MIFVSFMMNLHRLIAKSAVAANVFIKTFDVITDR